MGMCSGHDQRLSFEEHRGLLIEREVDRDGRLDLDGSQLALPSLVARFTLLDLDGDGYQTLEELARHGGDD